MAEITNPQVVRFANEKARPMADRLYSAWVEAQSVLQEYTSTNIGSLINDAGSGNLIADGSETDGRTRLTGGDIFNLITALTAYVAYVENGAVATADRRDVITKPHVNRG